MFSGIVEEIGRVKSADHQPGLSTFWIESTTCLEGTHVGDSIAVNGTCLTVCELTSYSFMCQAIPITIQLTNLGLLKAGMPVNLERSITPTTRIGGHFVQGHVDGFTTINRVEPEGESMKVWFRKPDFHRECLIPKGYIALDGMSLTLAEINDNEFCICFIPHTQSVTIVQHYQPGTRVNVEFDQITKTVVQIMNGRMQNV